MQEFLHNLARSLAWIQPFVIVAGTASFLTTATFALNSDIAGDRYLVPALLLCCWCLLVFTLVNMFSNPPPNVEQTRGFFKRLAVRIHRFVRNLVALSFLGLTMALIVLSYRLVAIGVG